MKLLITINIVPTTFVYRDVVNLNRIKAFKLAISEDQYNYKGKAIENDRCLSLKYKFSQLAIFIKDFCISE